MNEQFNKELFKYIRDNIDDIDDEQDKQSLENNKKAFVLKFGKYKD